MSELRKLPNMAKKSIVGLLGLGSLAIVLFPSSAKAAYLYWGSTRVTTSSISTCFQFAQDSMRSQGFQNVRRSGPEVTGSYQGVYAAITCVQTSPRATAIIMAVGDDGNSTASVRDLLSNQIGRITRID